MKCSPFSAFGKRGKRHGLRRRNGSYLGHSMENREVYQENEECGTDQETTHSHAFHKMAHGHHKFHKGRHGHHKFHKIGHHFKHEKMGHNHHKMRQGHFMHHKMRHGKRCFPGFLQKFENWNKCSGKPETDSRRTDSTYEPKSEAQVVRENDKFQICLDISHYQPQEVAVKIVDRKINVSAIHESMEDDLYEFHEMYRSFNLPNDVDPNTVSSRLDSNEKLIIEAPIVVEEERSSFERDVPVVRYGDIQTSVD